MKCPIGYILCLICASIGLGTRASADMVKLRGKPAFRNVTITGFAGGKLVFRGVSRQMLRKPLAQVEWLTIDALPQLTQAERGQTADPAAAVAIYQRLIDHTGQAWLRQLLRIRLVAALDRAGRFDDAVALYVKLLGERVDGAASARPQHPAPPAAAANQRARRLIETALQFPRYKAFAGDLRLLQLETLLWDRVEPLPPPFDGVPRASAAELASGDDATDGDDADGGDADGDAANGDGAPAPMFGHLPPAAASDLPRLAVDSFAFAAVEADLAEDRVAEAAERIAQMLPWADAAARDRCHLLLGRIELRRDRPGAALALLEPLTDGDGTQAAISTNALYYAGLANERLGRASAARRRYRQVLDRADCPDALRRRAADGLRRVGRD